MKVCKACGTEALTEEDEFCRECNCGFINSPLIAKKDDRAEVLCSVGLCKKPSYLIIDKEYRIYKSPVLSGYVRSQVRIGNLSVISLSRLKGMNCLKLHSDGGLQGDYGENEWSDIQELPEGFKVDA